MSYGKAGDTTQRLSASHTLNLKAKPKNSSILPFFGSSERNMQTRLIQYEPEEIKKLGLIEHHVKYKELHGEDQTVWLTCSEHNKLHHRLRKKGKCKIPPKELKIISKKASSRTNKFKEYHYNYSKNNIFCFSFGCTLISNVRLLENIVFNKKTGTVYATSYFRATNHKKLKVWSE